MKVIAIILTIVISMAGCSMGETAFSMVQTNVQQLQTQEVGNKVRVEGKVIKVAPFLQGGAYQIEDTTGKVWVYTNTKLPEEGQSVTVEGKITKDTINVEGQAFQETYIVQIPEDSPQEPLELLPHQS